MLPEIGSAVVTAGESAYPADIPIGTVTDVGRGLDDVTMRVDVELSNDVGDLHFVSVVLASAPEEFFLAPTVPTPSIGLGVDPDLLDGTDGDDGEEGE